MSNSTMLSLVLAGMLTAALLTIVILVARVGRLGQQIGEFRRRDAAIKSDAGKRARLLNVASISEQLAPLLPGFRFRYNPKDVQWIGGGAVDAVVWNGLQAGGDVDSPSISWSRSARKPVQTTSPCLIFRCHS